MQIAKKVSPDRQCSGRCGASHIFGLKDHASSFMLLSVGQECVFVPHLPHSSMHSDPWGGCLNCKVPKTKFAMLIAASCSHHSSDDPPPGALHLQACHYPTGAQFCWTADLLRRWVCFPCPECVGTFLCFQSLM